MRVIDADALKAQIEKENCKVCRNRNRNSHCLGCMVDEAITYLDEAPTADGWISVKDRQPKEHESIFYKFLGTPKWSNAMWKMESEKVLVCVTFPDGSSTVTTGCLHDSEWVTTISKMLPQAVTHWKQMPEPPKEEGTT